MKSECWDQRCYDYFSADSFQPGVYESMTLCSIRLGHYPMAICGQLNHHKIRRHEVTSSLWFCVTHCALLLLSILSSTFHDPGCDLSNLSALMFVLL